MGESYSLKIGFHGGAGEVTGSRHLIQAGGLCTLLDCGMFQGHRQDALAKNREFPFDPQEIHAVLLSHAHIDHSGTLPLLYKKGAEAPLYCTPATHELASLLLMDSARIQGSDAKFFNKIHAADGQTISPLYDEEDVELCLRRFRSCEYSTPLAVGPGVEARFSNAGHVLGSAMVQLDVDVEGRRRRIFFTGDLGRRRSLLMDPPQPPQGVDYLIMESTYGGRLHASLDGLAEAFGAVISRAVKDKGKILIPSFALERTQEIVYLLAKLRRERGIPPVPIYVDSPMAVEVTEIFNRHVQDESMDDAFAAEAAKNGDPFGMESIQYVRTKEESQALNDRPGPMIILSASGMCEGGRILHHLRNNLDKDTTTILMVGHQAEGTLGRRLQDGAKKVRIFGMEHEVWAKVETMQSLSSHADQADLLAFAGALDPKPRKIFLVHGDASQRDALAERLRAAGHPDVVCPEFGQAVLLD